ncbi:hypothetical protein QT381_12040 [Galbitalea sp. SE-J8]|uniref:hypothetical protein n=1 Tax=Galbitalea sp. SE-J8 TaxID=3054952 RepID=UPI00259C8043|nr:hypothetical protein [Galbitalea sp. SE-J8]MDM4763739.1 hypothetical protein [Galbitalea sp. SE-J8]
MFSARATDPDYLNRIRLTHDATANSLAGGVTTVMTLYFVLVALVTVMIAIARLFTPVDFDEYDRCLRAVLHLPKRREPAP